MMQPADDAASPSSCWWLRGLSVVWLALFLVWFFRFELPNGRLSDGTPVARSDVWVGLIDVLLENVFPTPGPQSPPSGWRFLPQRIGLLGVAALILAGGWGLGQLVLRALGVREQFDGASRTVFAWGLGLSGLSLLTLVCGLMGVLNRWVLAAALVALIIAECVLRFRQRSTSAEQPHRPWFQRRWPLVPLLCGTAVAPFVLAMLLGAMLPSTDFDVKEYHLEGPKEFFLAGRVTFLPHNVYASFPFLTEMLSLLAMALRDDWYFGALAGKAVLMFFAPLTALGLFAAGRRWFGPTVGWLSALLYLTTPWVYRISIIAYTEGGLTFYLFATLLAVLWAIPQRDELTEDARGRLRFRRVEEREDAARPQAPDASRILLCGLLAGSSVACKYPGVLSVAIPLGAVLVISRWRPSSTGAGDGTSSGGWRPVARAAGLFTLGMSITFGPWMLKNTVETGNPVYPLLYHVFGGTDWDEASHQKWQHGHPPAIVDLAKDPRALAKNLGSRVVDVIARSDWQSPLLFAAAPFALLWRRQRRLVLGLWAYVGWLFFSWWAFTHQIDRFWVPMLPVVALLAGAGLACILGAVSGSFGGRTSLRAEQLSLAVSAVAILVMAAVTLFNLAFITTRLCGYNAYLIDFNAARRDTTTPSIAVLREALPPGAKVLFVGEAQVFDADFDYVYNTVFDESLFQRWTSAAAPGVPADEQPLKPADEIRAMLREQGITHVFVNWAEVLRYRLTYGYTEYVSPERFEQLLGDGVLVPVPLDPRRVLRTWDSVDVKGRNIVEHWGNSLHLDVGGIEALRQYELFEVR